MSSSPPSDTRKGALVRGRVHECPSTFEEALDRRPRVGGASRRHPAPTAPSRHRSGALAGASLTWPSLTTSWRHGPLPAPARPPCGHAHHSACTRSPVTSTTTQRGPRGRSSAHDRARRLFDVTIADLEGWPFLYRSSREATASSAARGRSYRCRGGGGRPGRHRAGRRGPRAGRWPLCRLPPAHCGGGRPGERGTLGQRPPGVVANRGGPSALHSRRRPTAAPLRAGLWA